MTGDGHRFPVTINKTEWDNSYVCSPYTAFISYAQEELAKLRSPWLECGLRQFIHALDGFLRWGHINRVVHVNNWLLSTNLYPAWDGTGLEAMHARLLADYPDHALLWRSLNPVTNGPVLRKLRGLGYRLIPSRQVYLFDARSNFRITKNLRWDRRLAGETSYLTVSHDELTPADFPRIIELYNQLYLDKYSQHNPHFTAELVALWHRTRSLVFTGLRAPDGRLDGIVGIVERDGVTTVPVIGYATELPQELGLYRLLMLIAIEDAISRRLLLNLSAGAPHFKRIRGGIACLEYSAAHYSHLPIQRRLVWKLLDLVLTHIAVPLMRRFKL